MKKTNRSKPRVNRRIAAARPRRRSRRTTPRVPLRARLRLARARLFVLLARLRAPLLFVVRIAVAAAVVTGALAAGRLIERHVRTSEAFAVSVIELEGLSRLGRGEALQTAGLALGRNIFDVDPQEAEERLRQHPWIASVSVTRRLPGTYRIEIQERRAVALLSLGDLYLVSSNAIVFKKLGDGDPGDLPIITGIDREEFTTDRAFRTSVLTSAVTLLDDYSEAGLWRREPIAEIHLEEGQGFSLYIGSDASYVRLGKPPFASKLRRLRRVLDRLERKKARAAYVYLDNVRRPDRVAVRLR